MKRKEGYRTMIGHNNRWRKGNKEGGGWTRQLDEGKGKRGFLIQRKKMKEEKILTRWGVRV